MTVLSCRGQAIHYMLLYCQVGKIPSLQVAEAMAYAGHILAVCTAGAALDFIGIDQLGNMTQAAGT